MGHARSCVIDGEVIIIIAIYLLLRLLMQAGIENESRVESRRSLNFGKFALSGGSKPLFCITR